MTPATATVELTGNPARSGCPPRVPVQALRFRRRGPSDPACATGPAVRRTCTVDQTRGPGHDQAAGGCGGAPGLDLLPHVPGDGHHGVPLERGDAGARPAERWRRGAVALRGRTARKPRSGRADRDPPHTSSTARAARGDAPCSRSASGPRPPGPRTPRPARPRGSAGAARCPERTPHRQLESCRPPIRSGATGIRRTVDEIDRI